MRGLLLAASCLVVSALAVPALAQISAEIPPPSQTAQGQVSVTIYNNNLALVQDVRQLDIPANRSRQEFPDVSAQIRPETVTLTGQGIGIVEQNFDFDLLSPQALMQKAVGETVTLVRTNPANGQETRERARVLAANGGVVLQIGPRIEVLRDDGLPVRVIFDRVPENLRARPTLSVTVQSERGGRRPVTLTYLTPGLAWSADYVALFDEANGRMDVQGWITLTNNSGTPYVNANTLLVAGGVGPGAQGPSYGRPQGPLRQAGTESAGRERLGDFYLYPLPERTTIANRQTKQVSFLDVSNTPAARAYEYRNAWLGTAEQPQSANTVLRFSTSRDQGLGDALPSGTVRVYQRDARGNPQFVGESAIGHTPMGSELGLTTGQAFDVKVKPTVERRERINSARWRTTMRYVVTNARPNAVTVDLMQSGLWGDTRIVEESQTSERRSADDALWRVQVPANGETVVTATFDTRF
ncbi:MAG TPA: DUF4139 domain-containing protein [Allosphingosinicella sp.]|nr:DUF4139 domain-containing protein [Allosphingosinicella sp.]